MTRHIVILAAGAGTRLQSNLPKPLHEVAGKPLLLHALATAKKLSPQAIHIVYGPATQRMHDRFAKILSDDASIHWCWQEKPLGTAHAAQQAVNQVADPNASFLIFNVDTPLLLKDDLMCLLASVENGSQLSLLTAEVQNPFGLGRILRGSQQEVLGIIEEKDATDEQKQLCEIYSGAMAAQGAFLQTQLPAIDCQNAKNEYYLTSLVAIARESKQALEAIQTNHPESISGINTRQELSRAERVYQKRAVDALAKTGVTFIDPARVDIRGNVTTDKDVTIDVNVILEGDVHLGEDCYIGPGCVLRNTSVGARVFMDAHSVIEDSRIAQDCRLGPFVHLRPGSVLEEGARVGNFVEIKKSTIGAHSKVNHLSYIGDTTMGQAVNVGAGTITCNYDGQNKHQTTIGDGAFIGSNTQLVAPVTVGAGATIGAGSTITKDAPAEKLTLSRAKQQTITAWQRTQKETEE